MSQETRKKKRSILLKGGDNPVFLSFTSNVIQIAQRIDKKEGIKLVKSNKGVYYVIEIPSNNCLKLSYLLLKRAVREHLKASENKKTVDIEELFGETKSEEKKEEEVPFE